MIVFITFADAGARYVLGYRSGIDIFAAAFQGCFARVKELAVIVIIVVDGNAGDTLPPDLLGKFYAIGVWQIVHDKAERVGDGCAAYNSGTQNGKLGAGRGFRRARLAEGKAAVAQKVL